MITKTLIQFGFKNILIKGFVESGIPIVTLCDMGRDISGEDLESLDTTLHDEVQIMVGDHHAAKALHSIFARVLKAYEDQQ